MPTLVAALTLVALLKMADVDLPRWHLAFWFAVLVGLSLLPYMPRLHALGQALASFGGAWLYFGLLDYTNNRADRFWHWLILLAGFFVLLGSRFWIDLRVYGIAL